MIQSQTDVLIMSCDTITDYPLVPLINDFRIHDATLTCLLAQAPEFSAIVGKAKDKSEKDLIGLSDEDKSRIVFLNSEADFSENVSIKKSMIDQCPNFIINRNLLDAHVYIMKRWVIDYVVKHDLSSIKGELLPLLVQEQFTRGRSELKESHKLSDREKLNETFEPMKGPLRGLFLQPMKGPLRGSFLERESDGRIICKSHMITHGFCLRANNVTSYLEANKLVSTNPLLWNITPSTITPSTITPSTITSSKITPSTMRSVSNSVVGKELSIGEKSTVRRCVIGKKSVIGSKAKLQDSVVMQESTVGDG